MILVYVYRRTDLLVKKNKEYHDRLPINYKLQIIHYIENRTQNFTRIDRLTIIYFDILI